MSPSQRSMEIAILMAGIENAVMGAFSDGYDARGEGNANQGEAVARCVAIKERVKEALDEAVRDERERAAVIAETHVEVGQKPGRIIASAIRNQTL